MDMQERMKDIERYIQSYFVQESSGLKFARENSRALGVKSIHVPPHIGKLLYILTKIHRPKKILEIGTLAGYSALWMAEGLPSDGKILSLEKHEQLASLARNHIQHAGLQDQIEVRTGEALVLLRSMIEKKEGPFDLIFLDADKENYPSYLEHLVSLSRSGTLLITDNLIAKSGEIGSPSPLDRVANRLHEFTQNLSSHPRLETVLSTTIVGEKTRLDALGISIVK